MSALKTIAIIATGYLVVKYALPTIKQKNTRLPANNCSNPNNAGNGSNQQSASSNMPSFFKSMAELITDVTTLKPTKIYY